ncbi:MAG TPA: ABC transporter permease [Mycobacterium sp.]|nr:ABC transporter permease [Mycobacterium sp.]
MAKYALRRTLQAIPVLLGISLIVYAILLIAPGGPEARFAQNPRITADQIAAFRHRWGLDQPIPVQYCKWLGACGDKPFLINALPGGTIQLAGLTIDLPGGDNGVLHGDLGFSSTNGEAVVDVIAERLPPTLILAGTAWVIWVVIAFLSGVYAAVRRYSLFDSALTIFNYVGFSFPTFWLGIMLITIFAGTLHWLPAGGMTTVRQVPPWGTDQYWVYVGAHPWDAFIDLAKHMVLPVITLVVVNIAFDARFVRSSMLEALNQDYIRTARAKGVAERVVIFRHALKNALLPVITNLGLEIPFLFTGAFVTETIFSWPGMGFQFIQSTANYDYPVLMGILLVTAVVTVFANLLADIAYAVVDPRVKYD